MLSCVLMHHACDCLDDHSTQRARRLRGHIYEHDTRVSDLHSLTQEQLQTLADALDAARRPDSDDLFVCSDYNNLMVAVSGLLPGYEPEWLGPDDTET